MSNDWNYWQNALEGKFGPVHEGHPQTGFYRRRLVKNGPFVPVAIWHDGNDWIALVNGRPANAVDIWTWVCQAPITKEAYDRVAAGGAWDDASEFAPLAPPDGRNADPENELEALRDQIESAKARLSEFEKIDSDEARDNAQSLRARLNELSREADTKRSAEKQPHLEAGKAVDALWQPLVKDAKACADKIAAAMSAYETAKLRQQREEQARMDRERREAEEAAARASETGRPQAAPEATVEPDPIPAVAPTPIKGNYGRAANISYVKVVTAITDQDALYQFLRDHGDLKRCLLDLAQRGVKAGHDVPGIATEERAKVA